MAGGCLCVGRGWGRVHLCRSRGASRSGPTLVGLVLFGGRATRRVSTLLGIWGLMWVGLIWAYGQGIGIAQESAQLIKAIKIQGNKRIEAPAIRGRISLKEGEPFVAEKIREQIRAVYQWDTSRTSAWRLSRWPGASR